MANDTYKEATYQEKIATGNGVRKISEKVIQDGRALVITDEDLNKYSWSDLPDGTIKVNPNTGLMDVKLKGQTSWVPAGIKNDGTICIAKDSMIIQEDFVIEKVPAYANGRYGTTSSETFTYSMPTIDTQSNPSTTPNSFTGKVTADGKGLIFRLTQGTYMNLRNHLEVIIDDVLYRSFRTGGVDERNEQEFIIYDQLEAGQKITAKYIRIIRIGNPYPRVFMNTNTPDSSEAGDMWIDPAGDMEQNIYKNYLDNIEIDPKVKTFMDGITSSYQAAVTDSMKGYTSNNPDLKKRIDDFCATLDKDYPNTGMGKDMAKALLSYCSGIIPWEFTTHPSTIAGYGIQDNLSYNGHVHKKQDIIDFPSSLPASGGNSNTVGGYAPGRNANQLLVIDSNGKIPTAVLPDSEQKDSDFLTTGPNPPAVPVNDRSVWICTKAGEQCIKLYTNNNWIILHAAWS